VTDDSETDEDDGEGEDEEYSIYGKVAHDTAKGRDMQLDREMFTLLLVDCFSHCFVEIFKDGIRSAKQAPVNPSMETSAEATAENDAPTLTSPSPRLNSLDSAFSRATPDDDEAITKHLQHVAAATQGFGARRGTLLRVDAGEQAAVAAPTSARPGAAGGGASNEPKPCVESGGGGGYQ
jgi:hypothetical protein